MVLRIPAAGEPAAFGPPLAPARAAPSDALPAGARDQVERLQARDDALFVAGALAELAARRHAAAAEAESAAFAGENGLERAADGFAARLDAAFDADLAAVVAGARGLSGPRPSDAALDLLTRRAAGLRRGLGARAAVMEDALRRQGQAETVERAVDALREMVRSDADALEDAKARLGDLAAAAAPLLGEAPAKELAARARAELAEAAAGGLIARDPGRALEAIRTGAFDGDLDPAARTRLARAAERRRRAQAQDSARADAAGKGAEARARAAGAAAFLGGMERALRSGTARLADIADAEDSGILAPAQAERLRARIGEQDAAAADRDRAIARVGRRLAEGVALDPADADDRAAAEAYYADVVAAGFGEMSDREIAETLPRHAQALGIVPGGMQARLRGLLIAGAPEARLAAARAYEPLYAIDPTVFDALPRAEVRLALRLHELGGLDLPPEAAVRLAEDALDGTLLADDFLAAMATGGDETGGGEEGLSADDDAGPESGRLTSGDLRRGAERIGRARDGRPDIPETPEGKSMEWWYRYGNGFRFPRGDGGIRF